ncbi:two-component sensor histidine kinase [Clostridia bacterium]|nr:two-component sensor histidine kinase [Clostridia bacterium]
MKFDGKSIGVKLWLYFILFAAVILTALWLMQIVFLQSFYESMKTADVKEIADTIIADYASAGFETTIDSLTFRNALLVCITDARGNVVYTSDEHGPRGGPGGGFRPLPNGYAEFLAKLAQSADGRVSYSEGSDRFDGKSLVYGAKMGGEILYISTPLEPVNSTTDILRRQLVYVTAAALFLSFIVAFFIARKFSKPVSAISEQAGRLAKGEFDVTFDKGFCSELDELSGTLDHTARELSKVEKLRRDLLANISHDLRTPLTMIKAFAEMIHDISGDNKEKREAHLAVIARESDRLTGLVNDILDISVLQSGNAVIELANVNLSGTVKSVLAQFQPICGHEGYFIHAKIEPDQYVLADEKRLTQVLYNLIGNAVNYIGDDKTLAITLSDLGGRVRFEVADHGEGIPEEELPFIWDRYYKSKEHKRAAVGTGLGLSIAKEILEAHRADFGVNSGVGVGSTFWFELRK